MPKPAITTFSSVAVKPSSTNKDNGLYAPQLTAAQILCSILILSVNAT